MQGPAAGRRRRKPADPEWPERWRALGPEGQERVEAALAHGAAVDSPLLAGMAAEAAQRRLAASRVRRRWALALLAVAIVLALADGDALSSAGTLLSIGALTLIGVVGWRYASAEQRRLQRALEANGPQGARRSSGASRSSA